MPVGVSLPSRQSREHGSVFAKRVSAELPSLSHAAAAVLSAVLLILSFPNFDLSPLAWIALVPLFSVIALNPRLIRGFVLGWLFGTIFFYGSCYWLTYSMIHFGGIRPVLAYIVLLPGALIMGMFPAVCAMALAFAIRRLGITAVFSASVLWPATEWIRLALTGQLWNALGYSQAYHPSLIQLARFGGVYAVSFLIVIVNAAVAYIWLKRTKFDLAVATSALAGLALLVVALNRTSSIASTEKAHATVVAIQPNVPMDLVKSGDDMRMLTARHFELSESALEKLPADGKPRLIIWPESPMNFTYGTDALLRTRLGDFARVHNASVLFNSQEAAPNDGIYNSAVLINQQGSLAAQYDKIRLLPFGEYVPLPRWMPGAGLIGAIVGDFTPGTSYRLMSIGVVRAGVFICVESAYPSIARTFTREGADVLINISNDGYLGPTAVMRQHLANAVFRAVENQRPLLRVTNTGISAYITPRGEVTDATPGFQPAVRVWSLTRSDGTSTFYSSHGDVFVALCGIVSLLVLALSAGKTARRV